MSFKFFTGSESNLSDIGHFKADRNNDLRKAEFKTSDEDFEKVKCLENAFCDGKFEKPDDILLEKIVNQVEFLLSDANILKDKFLLKHMRRNKEGYISLKLISSLRKVKTLSKDWRVVAYSLKKSQKLQMNEEMTKIKRIDPLPLIETTDLDRSVLVFCYPPKNYEFENLRKELNKLENVSLIFIVHSKTDTLNMFVNKTLKLYEDIVSFPFALVKFQSTEDAAKSVLQASQPTSFLKLVRIIDENEHLKSTLSISPKERILQSYVPDVSNLDSKISFSEFKSYSENFLTNFGVHRSPSTSRFTTLKSNGVSNEQNYFQRSRDYLNDLVNRDETSPVRSYRGDGPGNNRWAQRRFFTNKFNEPRVVILRQPKGPDGTKGFWKSRRNTPGSPEL